MLYLLYLSVFFALVCLGIFLLNHVKKEDRQVKEPFILHEIEDTKTNIPEFTLPKISPKRLQDNNRDAQFTRSLERIVGINNEIEKDNVQEELSVTQQETKIEENSVPIVNHGNSHSYYQQLLQSKEFEKEEAEADNEISESGYSDITEELRRDKINILLKKASEISQDTEN
ncbi:hypothetical protein LPB90_18475 [Chryseobacterium sp. LC2016-29]|uniref:hypothetical protein n=1 Tax=Chryseobacterium sp. LC2016-29 TaxID=2897331 RepID=UPI001E65979C|nr:hypothetical protein [Chryseobacterium sp. LC2016-29]MCD0480429.1 hypothetical protein [Chryseobacterium sp. LC2016-29]